MPIYYDLHPPGVVPLPVISRGIEDARSGAEDEYHVRQVDHYCAPEGSIYCVLESPSPEGVRARHAQRGLACGEVVPVTGVASQLPLSAQARQALDRAIQQDWQARHRAV